jgi:hypothetical protein
MAVVHRIPAADSDLTTRPDADAASDSPSADPFTEALGEDHHKDTVADSEFACRLLRERVGDG